MSLRASSASAGRMALQSRSRLLARTTNPSLSSSSSSSSLVNSNSWQEYNYSHHRRRSGSVNELHTFATRLSLEDNKNSDDRDEHSKRRLQSTGAALTLPSSSMVLSGSGRRSNNSGSVANYRYFHTSPPQERAVAIILGAGALSATFYAASSAVSAYKEYQASQPVDNRTDEEKTKDEEAEAAASKEQQETQQKETDEAAQQKAKEPRENIFSKWFGVGVGAKYYEGGFEESMTRREAALILGVRESSSAKRIKDAHRKLLILNHPDTGGSTYMSLKINEAKELLLKGKGRV